MSQWSSIRDFIVGVKILTVPQVFKSKQRTLVFDKVWTEQTNDSYSLPGCCLSITNLKLCLSGCRLCQVRRKLDSVCPCNTNHHPPTYPRMKRAYRFDKKWATEAWLQQLQRWGLSSWWPESRFSNVVKCAKLGSTAPNGTANGTLVLAVERAVACSADWEACPGPLEGKGVTALMLQAAWLRLSLWTHYFIPGANHLTLTRP